MSTKMLITIDPGVRHFAAATWMDGSLHQLLYLEPLERGGLDYRFNCGVSAYAFFRDWTSAFRDVEVVIETPKIYDAQHQKGDQKDIRDLAMSVGALGVAAWCAGVNGVSTVEPRTWKGTVDKKVMLQRIYQRAKDEPYFVRYLETEAQRVKSGMSSGKGPGADVLDAIGIGLWKLNRLPHRRTR